MGFLDYGIKLQKALTGLCSLPLLDILGKTVDIGVYLVHNLIPL
jgi:hypothetical protein